MEPEIQSRLEKATESVTLPSWNPGASKRALIDFVTQVTRMDNMDYIPVPERIAVFDNDGTLWAEKPLYIQLAFVIDQIKALAPQRPEWQNQEPFRSVLQGDIKGALAGGIKSAEALLAATHAGMTTDEFENSVKTWFVRAQHPVMKCPYIEMIYQPMLEVINFLKLNNFKVYIASAGGVDFMRAVAEKIYGIPPEHVIGSSGKTKYDHQNGKAVLVKHAEVDTFDEGPGKPPTIHKFLGRRPVIAFGNSDGDFEMLEWVGSQQKPHLCMLLHHTDLDREWAYDRESHIGKLDRALDFAPRAGWTIIDMKRDWKRIYPFQS